MGSGERPRILLKLDNNKTGKARFLEDTARKDMEKVKEKSTVSVLEVKEVVHTAVKVCEWLNPRRWVLRSLASQPTVKEGRWKEVGKRRLESR